MSKRKRLGTVRMRLTDFTTLVTLTDKLRRKAEWYAGERARLIEACEELQAKLRRQHESNSATCTTLREMTGERDYWKEAYQNRDNDTERAALIGRCERLQGAMSRQTVTCKQLTEERQQINDAIRTLNDVVIGALLPGDVANACIAVCAFLPPDAPSPEGD